MASVYRQRPRGVWMIQYFRDGVRHCVSSGTTSKSEAGDMARDLETDKGRGLPTPLPGKMTWDDAVTLITAEYALNGRKSADELERRVRLHLTPVFGGRKMASITGAEATQYAAARRAAGAKVGTVNRELDVLRRMFTLAVEGGVLLYQPHIQRLSGEHLAVRRGFFEPAAFAAIRAHLPEPLRPIVTFAYITGWRIDSEVLTLEWSRVDLQAREVRLDTSKNGEARVFVMTDELYRLLTLRRTECDRDEKRHNTICPWVFYRLVATVRGGAGPASRHVPKPVKRFNKAWKIACAAAHQVGKIPHDLRRTAVRNMVRAGISESVAMKMSGHKTRSVFDRYNIVSGSDLRDAAAKLAGVGK